MSIDNINDSMARIKVIGVGGGGNNAITRMLHERIQGVQLICVNTDAQALMKTEAPLRIRIGDNLTRGLGVGGNPELGRASAEESRDELLEQIKGSDMVFIAAGMGGGTGTGAAPVIAELIKETGALTVAVVTKPFAFEGTKRATVARQGLQWLKDKVDTLLVIPNDRLLDLCDQQISVNEAFKMADDVLRQGIQAISDVITVPGEINLDFADVKAIMSNAGTALMAIGIGTGESRATDAARSALNSPLMDVSIDGATGVLFNITGGNDLTLNEVNEAAELISKSVDPEAEKIFGVVTDPDMDGEVKITIIATGLYSPGDEDLYEEDETQLPMFDKLDGNEEEDLDLPPFIRRSMQKKDGHSVR